MSLQADSRKYWAAIGMDWRRDSDKAIIAAIVTKSLHDHIPHKPENISYDWLAAHICARGRTSAILLNNLNFTLDIRIMDRLPDSGPRMEISPAFKSSIADYFLTDTEIQHLIDDARAAASRPSRLSHSLKKLEQAMRPHIARLWIDITMRDGFKTVVFEELPRTDVEHIFIDVDETKHRSILDKHLETAIELARHGCKRKSLTPLFRLNALHVHHRDLGSSCVQLGVYPPVGPQSGWGGGRRQRSKISGRLPSFPVWRSPAPTPASN